LLSWVVVKETIDRATALAILAVFAGVLVIASGSIGRGHLLGDGFALANAASIAAYYVTLRTTGRRNMLPHVALGSILGGLIAASVADFAPISPAQAWLILLSGAVILPGAVGLLMRGRAICPRPRCR
jgi:drug/metabolite transporter (DMT)-like permease